MANPNLETRSHLYSRYFVNLEGLYKTKKTKVYTGIIATLITIIFFIVFAIKPTLITIAQLIREVQDQRRVLTTMEEKISDLSKAQTNYLNTESKIYLLDEALPLDAEVNSLTKQLEALGRKSQVSFERFRINEANLEASDEIDQTKKQPVEFNLTVLGSYENLRQFANLLTNLRRIVTIESFVFQIGREGGGLLALNINGQAWFLAQ